MKLFGELKKNKYVENMTVMNKTSLSLLNTLNQLQDEYDKAVIEFNQQMQKLTEENNKLRAELIKVRGR